MASPERSDARTGPDDAQTVRLQRLGDAMDAFLKLGPDRDPEAVGRFLAEHAPLRDLLEPMLAARDGDDAASDADDASAENGLVPGRCIDDYRIVRLVGRGGTGTVYEAEQLSLSRRVALKVLHGHLAWSAGSIERFRREAVAASRLRHPAIVPIHDVGEWRGQHWFSMEFVDGRALHELTHADRLGVRPDLSRVAEVAEVAARVADALQHAHDHGFVHRDVKPHNVMIGDDGTVRLLDFGLAKHLESDARSRTGEFVGTPHYCSPEQVAVDGRVGPRSDVFSLGIVLYELLARRRPFDGETARAVMTRIERGEFEPLARAAPAVPRDLQVICHKALEPDPGERYASAGEFAADLRRFLRIEPILARPPGAVERWIKWVRRHRARAALWAAAAVIVVAGPAGYALHVHDAASIVERERALLLRAEEIAFEGIERTLTLLTDQLDRQPGPGSRQQPHVDAVVRQCEQFLALRVDDPERTDRVARALYLVSGVYLQLGRHAEALAACRRSRELLATAKDWLEPAFVSANEGRLLRRELRIRQLLDPFDADDVFERAVAHCRDQVEAAGAGIDTVLEYAETLLLRARALADRPHRRPEAERLLHRVQAVLTPQRRTTNPRAAGLALQTDVVLGHVELWTGRTTEALARLEAAVARIGELPADPRLGVDEALAKAAIGDARQLLGQPAEAEQALRAAIATATPLAREYPGSRPLHRALLRSRLRLGSLLLVQGRVDPAEAMLRETAAMVAAEPTDASWLDRAVLADLDLQLANCILMRDRGGAESDEAATLLHAACARFEELLREHPDEHAQRVDLGAALHGLAALANQRGDHEAAAGFAARAAACQEAVLRAAPRTPRARQFLGMHQGQLALALAGSGRRDEVEAAVLGVLRHAAQHVPTLRLAAEAATAAADPAGHDGERHAALAVRVLERVAESDPARTRRWLAEPCFAPLRERTDFRALARRLGGR